MKKFLLSILLLLLWFVGCLPVMPVAAPVNQPPVAYIDSVSASQIAPGDEITFTGHGVDPDGSIVAYRWWSSINGDLNTSPSFFISSLSEGMHTIWFKVQDNAGVWSKEVSANVNVVSISNMPPKVKLFQATPSEIDTGLSFTLSWDVSNASWVDIEPDIGYVSSTGNRTLLLLKDTEYKLTATNKMGSVTSMTKVTFRYMPISTVELYAIAAESGHVRYDGYVGTEPNVGEIIVINSAVGMEAFLSYDISSIPQGTKIKSASLDFTDARMFDNPFLTLGSLYIYPTTYNVLGKKDFVQGFVGGFIHSTGRMPIGIVSSAPLTEAVQVAVDSQNPRFQIRLQFTERCYDCAAGRGSSYSGYIALAGNGSRLTVKY